MSSEKKRPGRGVASAGEVPSSAKPVSALNLFNSVRPGWIQARSAKGVRAAGPILLLSVFRIH